MNDDLVVSKILKLLENNTAFIGYALNGGIGTKINVRNTETGKTIQALSINVDSTGEVLVVKDSEDGQFKAVTFKTAEKVSERIIQLRKTKPVDDKKTLEYTDSDIEVFYLFVKLIDTGSPVPSQLTSTWIRKGSSCTQFVGAYERCNYASKETIGGVGYTGLPYKPYESLQDCLNDDLGRDAATPHGTKDQIGMNPGWRVYSTKMTDLAEQNLLVALESHDKYYKSSYKKLFGYGSILECSGAMYVQGWQSYQDPNTNEYFTSCDFSFFPGFTTDCTITLRNAGFCDNRGFINSKTPPPNDPASGGINNRWGHEYGWVNLPYDFMYKRYFPPLYVNGSAADGGFLIFEGLTEDQQPTIPPGYFLWEPGCPINGQGGPYDGSGGNRFPDGVLPIRKRDMKLSTHKAEIWFGSNKKKEAIKLYELGLSDLFSGMYNAFITRADESPVDIETRLNRGNTPTQLETLQHNKFYENWNKNIIDLRLDPRVWVYILNNIPRGDYTTQNLDDTLINPTNRSIQLMLENLYNRTINLTIVDKKIQVVHLKLGLTPKNNLTNTDCKGNISGSFPTPGNDLTSGQSWEYQKYITIKIKDWKIETFTNTLDTSVIPSTTWNKDYIERKFFTSFSNYHSLGFSVNSQQAPRDSPNNILLRHNNSVLLTDLVSGNHYEQYNYNQAKIPKSIVSSTIDSFVNSGSNLSKPITFNDAQRVAMRSTSSWWALWERTQLNATTKRLNSIVGYDVNYHQILTSYGLNPTLDYVSQTLSNQVDSASYWEYLSSRPKNFIPSNIRSIRNKLVSTTSLITLANRESLLTIYGINYPSGHIITDWSRYITSFRLDGLSTELILNPSPYYKNNSEFISQTREQALVPTPTGNIVFGSNRRFSTDRWFNRLWTQFIYDGFINVDVESYRDVEFKHPTNPSKYIKYAVSQEYANSEYSFVLNNEQTLETVLTPGTQDLFKQVKITKPTNLDLDPNYSFLVYMLPNVEVTKKKKTI